MQMTLWLLSIQRHADRFADRSLGNAATRSRPHVFHRRVTGQLRRLRIPHALGHGIRAQVRPESVPKSGRNPSPSACGIRRRHGQKGFLAFLNRVDAAVPDELDVHIIMDNYATHRTPHVHDWFKRRPRFHAHFTPTYFSWLNLVERLFADLTERQLRRGSHRSTIALEQDIREFIEVHNDDPKLYDWTKSAESGSSTSAAFPSAVG